MKYVIVYNDKEIAFADAVEDNTITYYPDKGYYCKVFKTEEDFLKAKDVIEEAFGQRLIDSDCVSCYREWLTDLKVAYTDKMTKDQLKALVTTSITTSNYPKDKKIWTDTVAKIFDIDTKTIEK